MKILAYFFLGLVATIIGALPLGTVNVAVINTTIKESLKEAFKIIVPAAIGELLLALFALHYFKQIESFIMAHIWLQYLIVAILLVLGLVLIFGKRNCIRDDHGECVATKKRPILSKYGLGFVLGLFNPTVLIYWLFVISFFMNSAFELSPSLSLLCLITFFIGVFTGKTSTLYGYAIFSNVLKMKMKGITAAINKVIGVLLLMVALVQVIKLWY